MNFTCYAAVISGITLSTLTEESVFTVGALTSVQTRIRLTLIDIWKWKYILEQSCLLHLVVFFISLLFYINIILLYYIIYTPGY